MISFQTKHLNLQVGRVTPCAPPQLCKYPPNGAHGVTRPTTLPGSWAQDGSKYRSLLLLSLPIALTFQSSLSGETLYSVPRVRAEFIGIPFFGDLEPTV